MIPNFNSAQKHKDDTTFESTGLPESYRDVFNSNPYANYEYQSGLWDNIGNIFGFRTKEDDLREANAQASREYIAQLQNQAREEAYNSPAEAVEREKAAGLHPDITGTTATNQAAEGVEMTGPDYMALGSDSGSSFMQNVFSAITSVIGIQNALTSLRSMRLDNTMKDINVSKSLFDFGNNYARDTFRFTDHPNETFRFDDKSGKYGWYSSDGALVEEIAPAGIVDDDLFRRLGLSSRSSRKFKSAFQSGYSAGLSGLGSMLARQKDINSYVEEKAKGRHYDFTGLTGSDADGIISEFTNRMLNVWQLKNDADAALAKASKTKSQADEAYDQARIDQNLGPRKASAEGESYDSSKILSEFEKKRREEIDLYFDSIRHTDDPLMKLLGTFLSATITKFLHF